MPEDTGEQDFTIWVESRRHRLDRLQILGQINGNDLFDGLGLLWSTRLLCHLACLLGLTRHHTLGEDHWAGMGRVNGLQYYQLNSPLHAIHLLKAEHLLHLSLLLGHLIGAHANKSQFAWVDHLLGEESSWHHVAVHCF